MWNASRVLQLLPDRLLTTTVSKNEAEMVVVVVGADRFKKEKMYKTDMFVRHRTRRRLSGTADDVPFERVWSVKCGPDQLLDR